MFGDNFVAQDQKILRKFVDFDQIQDSETVTVTSDAAKSPLLGFATCYVAQETKQIFYACD